jgi:hypothetical protein
MKSNILKRIKNLENGLKSGKKIPFLYYKYPVFLGSNRDSEEAKEARAQAALQKKFEEVSQERGEKITEEDVEVIVGIRQFFDKDEERSAIV